MSSKVSLIRGAIKTVLESVTGIGIVHDRKREARDWKSLLDLFRYNEEFQGIEFQQKSFEVNSDEDRLITRKWNFTLLKQFNDSENSEYIFDDLIESIFNKFQDSNLGNQIIEHTSIKLIDKFEDEISDVLCHVAILELITIDSDI